MKIQLYRNQIKLEVDTETRKASLYQAANGSQEQVYEAQMGTDFSDKAYFERKCQQGIDALVDLLHRFVKSCTSVPTQTVVHPVGIDADNQNDSSKVWTLELDIQSYRDVKAGTLVSLCHRFVSANMLYSWAIMTMPSLAPQYRAMKEETTAELLKAVYRKSDPVLTND